VPTCLLFVTLAGWANWEHAKAQRAEHAVKECLSHIYREPVWTPDQEKEWFCGLTQEEFRGFIYSNDCHWGYFDETIFSDVSVILQFDVGNRVRLIGYRAIAGDWHHDPATLADVWLDADEYYRILKQWLERFEAEWAAAPKISKSEDGAKPLIEKLRAQYGNVIDWDETAWD
jgi:hypothetical protein